MQYILQYLISSCCKIAERLLAMAFHLNASQMLGVSSDKIPARKCSDRVLITPKHFLLMVRRRNNLITESLKSTNMHDMHAGTLHTRREKLTIKMLTILFSITFSSVPFYPNLRSLLRARVPHPNHLLSTYHAPPAYPAHHCGSSHRQRLPLVDQRVQIPHRSRLR